MLRIPHTARLPSRTLTDHGAFLILEKTVFGTPLSIEFAGFADGVPSGATTRSTDLA